MKTHLMKFILLVVCLTAGLSTWAQSFKVDGIEYRLGYPGTVYISNGNKCSGDVIIPDSVQYNGLKYLVAGMDRGAFSHCWDLTSITLPNAITNIETSAFKGCI